MAIANGISNNQAEREQVLNGFREQLEVVEQSQIVQEQSIKAKLYDIITDCSISDVERTSLEQPLNSELAIIAEKHSRIRRSIFIGLYSFWEVSLNAICDMVNFCTNTTKGYKSQKKEGNEGKSKAWIYLNYIYGDAIPEGCLLIDGAIRILRNYMVHGNLTDSQKYDLSEFCSIHTEYSIKNLYGDFVITDYKGLTNLLDVISNQLSRAEKQILIKTK